MADGQSMNKKLKKTIGHIESLIESENYKDALKKTEDWLKKQPKDLVLQLKKAYILHKMEDTDSGLKMVQDLLKTDMKNAEIWKTYGLIFKETKQYDKALSCFRNAQKHGHENDPSIILEIGYIGLVLNKFGQFYDLSRQLAQISPSNSSAVRYIIACVLVNQCEDAIHHLENLDKSIDSAKTDEEKVFISELARFHCSILLRNELYEKCLAFIDSHASISDRISILEYQATCYEKLDRKEDLLKAVYKLIDQYPDNGDYFEILERTISREDYIESLFKVDSNFARVRLMEMLDIDDARFDELMEKHTKPLVMKGSPAIFATLKEMSQDKLDKIAEYVDKLDYPMSSTPIVHIFKAQVLFNKKEYDKGLEELDLSIKHTPTVVEHYIHKIKILSKLGRNSEALEAAKIVSDLDPADRNTNNILSRTYFRNGSYNTAIICTNPFAKGRDKENNLMKNQFNKMHLRAAKCLLRNDDEDNAITAYKEVCSNYVSFKDSLISFVHWGPRRPITFLEMVEWTFTLPDKKHIARAVGCLFGLYFKRNTLSQLQDTALRYISSKNPNMLAYLALYFAHTESPLSALKCFLKISGKHQLLASYSMENLVKKKSEWEPIIQDLFDTYYKKCEFEPEKEDDFFFDAKGRLYAGDVNGARESLLKELDFDKTYSQCLDIFLFAKVEISDETFTQTILNVIQTKWPYYEIIPRFPEQKENENDKA